MDTLLRFRVRHAELVSFLDLIQGELDAFNKLAQQEPTDPFMRRMKVRVMFSCIDAHLFHLKSSAAALALGDHGLFSQAELDSLNERERNENGRVVKTKVTLKDNVKWAFGSFARAIGKQYHVDFGSSGGQSFLAAIEIRDRVTHPKTSESWTISEADLDVLDRAWNWFGTHLSAVSQPCS